MYERIYGKKIQYNDIFVNLTTDLSEEQKDKLETAKKLSKNEKKQLNNITKYIKILF